MSESCKIVHEFSCIVHLDVVERTAVCICIFRTDNLAFLDAHGIACRIETSKCDIIIIVLCEVNLQFSTESLACECPEFVCQRFCSITVHLKSRYCMVDAEKLVCLVVRVTHECRTFSGILHDQHGHQCVKVFLTSAWNSLVFHDGMTHTWCEFTVLRDFCCTELMTCG